MKTQKKILFSLMTALWVCLCAFSSCFKETEPLFTPVAAKDLTVILHAGGGADGMRYMNAQETFLTYYNQGYRYFEYDLKLSTDGRLIGSHAGEFLEHKMPEQLTYEEFKELRLENGFTPVNEEWLMQTIIQYPDVKIVVDAKMPDMEGDAAVLARIEQLEGLYNCDVSPNIIPEVFSKEMWDIVKETTTFDRYFFSHYKVYYSVGMILDYFDDDWIYGVAIPAECDSSFRSQIYRLKKEGKKIFVFTPTTTEGVLDAIQLGADGVYTDNPVIIPND